MFLITFLLLQSQLTVMERVALLKYVEVITLCIWFGLSHVVAFNSFLVGTCFHLTWLQTYNRTYFVWNTHLHIYLSIQTGSQSVSHFPYQFFPMNFMIVMLLLLLLLFAIDMFGHCLLYLLRTLNHVPCMHILLYQLC